MGKGAKAGRDGPSEMGAQGGGDFESEDHLLDVLADEFGLEPIVIDEDGMYVLRGWLTPEAGAALVRALEAAEDDLYPRERLEENDASGSGSTEPTSVRQTEERQRRWADAIGLVAQRALAAGLEERAGSQGGSTEPASSRETRAGGSTEPLR